VGVARSHFLKNPNLSDSSLKTLVKNGIFEEFEKVLPRFSYSADPRSSVELSELQQTIRDKIRIHFEKEDIFLLHGITGSGKTAIYISFILDILQKGKQVLYLLPEIALTTQIVSRLARVFGNSFGVYHSRYSDNERVEIWNSVKNGQLKFVVGVRSSVFLPFSDLGMIIIDEEHDSSLKQFEPEPRYHARDTALVLARFHGAKVLMGSATPSLETYHQARTGKYGYTYLNKRFGDYPVPKISLVNLNYEQKKERLKGEFSETLVTQIENRLDKKEQTILFQNRRGYSPTVYCRDCGTVVMCPNCSVTPTFHKAKGLLRCHYCGNRFEIPKACGSCGSVELRLRGYGTEKLEEELAILFPEAVIERMDQDTTRGKYKYQKIIEGFEQGAIDILVGTQMITKGLDFKNVSLVGILDADRMMFYPDPRAMEKTYQLLTQVSGRTGRSERGGEVIIQTYNPKHWLFDYIINHRTDFYEKELAERRDYHYPPYYRLIGIEVKNKDRKTAYHAAKKLSETLCVEIGFEKVFGPIEPMIYKIRNYFIYSLIIKIERGSPEITTIKQRILTGIDDIRQEQQFSGLKISLDVDPQ
jgi:primosomal protein N' (replication factor Y)